MRTPDELREAIEAYLAAVELAPELGGLEDAIRYALDPGGKRIRPVLCLAVAESAGGTVEEALPAAARRRARAHVLARPRRPARSRRRRRAAGPPERVAHGEGIALLAGDALLVEALPRARLRRSAPCAGARGATLGMIAGQFRDVTGERRRPRRTARAQDRQALPRSASG